MDTNSAQQVMDKILADARAEAETIKKQAEEKLATEQSQLDQQLSEYKKQTELLAKKAADDKKLHLLAEARMNIAKKLLAEKRKILDKVFAQAAQRLKDLPDDQYRQFITKLILDAVQTGDEEIIVGKDDKRINHDFVKELNRRLGPGYKGNLRLAEQREKFSGGFILKRGKVKTNASFEVLLEEARNSLETELAKDLFGS